MKIRHIADHVIRRRVFERLLIYVSIAVCSACVILALHASEKIRAFLSVRTDAGQVVSINNAVVRDDGSIVFEQDPRFNLGIDRAISLDMDVPCSPVNRRASWDQIAVGGRLFVPTSVVAADEEYPAIVGLGLIEGSFFGADDVEQGRNMVVVSRSAATTLFGNPASAVGASMECYRKAGSIPGSYGLESSWSIERFSVTGVFEDQLPILADIYGDVHFMIPISRVAGDSDPIDTFMFRSGSMGESEARVRVTDIVDSYIGEPNHSVTYLGKNRRTEATIRRTADESLRVALFFGAIAGVAILVIIIGLSAAMTIDVSDSEQEIGIRRAVGATKLSIARLIGVRGLRESMIGTLFGIVISMVLASPVIRSVLPILYAEGDTFSRAGIDSNLGIIPVLLSTGATGIAGLFSALVPVVSIVRAQPSEHLRCRT